MRAPVFGRRSTKREGEGEGEVTPFPQTPRNEAKTPHLDMPAAAAPAEAKAATPVKPEPAPVVPTPFDALRLKIQSIFLQQVDIGILARLPRKDVAEQVTRMLEEILSERKITLNEVERRDTATQLINSILNPAEANPAAAPAAAPVKEQSETDAQSDKLNIRAPTIVRASAAESSHRAALEDARARIQTILLERIDVTAASRLPRKDLARQISKEKQNSIAAMVAMPPRPRESGEATLSLLIRFRSGTIAANRPAFCMITAGA